MKTGLKFLVLALVLSTAPLKAESSFSGLIDTYYAWDFNPSVQRVRTNTTQPIKHDTFSTNLAMLGYKFEEKKLRGTLTLQTGDSVDANYAPEVKRGQRVKNFQEAYVGYRLLDNVWMDAGIYLGHIGNESWISVNNWTYSRSLQLDYVPYYTSGIRFSGKHGQNHWQLHLMNGWQKINEDNGGKAVGTSYTWHFESWSLTYNTQVGQETFPGKRTSGLRTYQNLHWELPGKVIDWKMAVDVGTQNVPSEKRSLVWGATSSQWRYRITENFGLAARVEYFHDARGAINQTGRDGNFRVFGTSLNADYKFQKGLLGRLELRNLQAADPIYENRGAHNFSDTFLVSSLSYQF